MKLLATELQYDEIEQHRKDDCVNYSNCLEEVAKMERKTYRDEGSFSCQDCKDYKKVDEDYRRYTRKDSSALTYPDYKPMKGGIQAFKKQLLEAMKRNGFQTFKCPV